MAEQKIKTTSELIFLLLSEDGHIDSLLDNLGRMAKDCEPHDYGLPIADPERAMLREAVLIWLANLIV